jgi:hypothetical protein
VSGAKANFCSHCGLPLSMEVPVWMVKRKVGPVDGAMCSCP